MGNITGTDKEFKRLRDRVKDLRVQQINDTKTAMRLVLEEFIKRTPVYTGNVLRNYTFSIGHPDNTVKDEIKSPLTGFEGTNAMPLGEGAEPRFAANAAAARRDLESVLAGLIDQSDVVMTNNSPDFHAVDAGIFPGAPFKTRNPGGITLLALQSVRTKLRNWK